MFRKFINDDDNDDDNDNNNNDDDDDDNNNNNNDDDANDDDDVMGMMIFVSDQFNSTHTLHMGTCHTKRREVLGGYMDTHELRHYSSVCGWQKVNKLEPY